MTEHNHSEAVEQIETNEVRSLTAEPPETLEEAGFDIEEEGTDKVAEEIEPLEKQVEDLPPLPTAKEAEFGELHRPRRGQFEGCKLVDEGSSDLIGFIKGDI